MKKKTPFLLFFMLLLLVINLKAQDAESRYETGKQFLQQGKYNAAMEAFRPLLSDNDNPRTPYVYYFYALSALKKGDANQARDFAKQLELKYPGWDKKDEAAYLLANIQFEQGKYKEALETLQSVSSRDLKKDIPEMKMHYLSQMDNTESLKWLQKSFPKDREVALALATALSESCDNEKDKMLLIWLKDEFRFTPADLKIPVYKTVKKDVYNVAVLFPFMINQLNNPKRPNQFILDMYEGIRLAVDSLMKTGAKINLYAYDTEKDVEKFSQLLQNSEIKKMDLLIGPVYPAQVPVLADFAKENQIEVIAPFFTELSLTQNNPFLLLFQPALPFQGKQTANFVRSNYKPQIKSLEPEKKGAKPEKILANEVFVFYGDSEKDSLLADAYRLSLMYPDSTDADSTYNISVFEKVTRENVGRLREILTDSSKMEKVNNIFVASSDQVIAANVISSTEISGFDIPVFTTSDWLDFNLITVEQMERRNVHFLYPDYVDLENTTVQQFKEKYLSATHQFPTTFAFAGYDMMFQFGKLLLEKGTFFTRDLKKGQFYPGPTLMGINYKNSQDNTFVPIVKFEHGKLEPVNGPKM